MSPPITLSRRQLIILLLVISLVPPIFVISMTSFYTPPPEPELLVEVEQGVKLHYPRKASSSPKLLPCVTLTNLSGDVIRKLAVSINDQFFFYPPELQANEKTSLPLEFFVTKGGNVAFQPGSETVDKVTVYGQITTGARAVRDVYFDAQGNVRITPLEKP